jgi:hypothetical protein
MEKYLVITQSSFCHPRRMAYFWCENRPTSLVTTHCVFATREKLSITGSNTKTTNWRLMMRNFSRIYHSLWRYRNLCEVWGSYGSRNIDCDLLDKLLNSQFVLFNQMFDIGNFLFSIMNRMQMVYVHSWRKVYQRKGSKIFVWIQKPLWKLVGWSRNMN